MLKRFLLILFIYLVIAGCVPAPTQSTSTAGAVEALTETAAPTVTPVPSLTPTPTATPTATPSPTPSGGGNGTLLFFLNPWRGDRNPALREEDGLYLVNSDGSGLRQILSRSQIESMIGKKFKYGSYARNGSQGYIFADGLYSITDDWQLIHEDALPNAPAYIFSFNGKYVMYLQGGYIYASGIDGSEPKRLLRMTDRYIGWSADGSTVYFTRDQGASMWAINADGSNKRELELDALENFTLYEGVPTPEGVLDLGVPIYRLDTYAVSPDKTRSAFTWGDLIFIASATDAEFLEPQLIMQIPGTDMSTHASEIIWSPDNNYLLVGLYNNRGGFGDVILVKIQEKKAETVFSGRNYYPCGFSPDGRILIARYNNFAEKKSVIELTSLDRNTSSTIEWDGSVNCPVWQ